MDCIKTNALLRLSATVLKVSPCVHIGTDSSQVTPFSRFNRQKRQTGFGLKWSQTCRRVNLAEKYVHRSGGQVDRRKRPEIQHKSGSHPDSTVRLAGVCPQRHSPLSADSCPSSNRWWLRVSFFLSTIIGPADWHVFPSVVRSKLLCTGNGVCVYVCVS